MTNPGPHSDVVIVGAGQAGAGVARGLRDAGFSGSIALFGEESEPPYERPSLSKEMLLDPIDETIAWANPVKYYGDSEIDLRLGACVIGLDCEARRIRLGNGEALHYDTLVLATGARVRRLDVPGADGAIHYVRSLDDSRTLRARLSPGSRIAIIGAGFIGLEVAAAAIARGCAVTVVELGPAPLGRVAPPTVQGAYRRIHEAHGVIFRFGRSVTGLRQGPDGHLVSLDNGETLEADLVVAGIGVIANDDLAREAGLPCDRGILVDANGVTADPHIYAVGDVAQRHHPWLGYATLIESWHNAQSSATVAARHIAHAAAAPVEVPWFWSDQYDTNLQIFGTVTAGADEVVRGDPLGRSWLLLQRVEDRIVCAIGVNAGRDLRPVRELMASGSPVSRALLEDQATPLVEIMRRGRQAHAAT